MRTAHLSDGETAYCIHGDRGPWVVLVHGMTTPSFAWRELANAIAEEGFQVLRYDAFGRGFSDRPRLRYRRAVYVRQLHELIGSLGVQSPHLVGWSLGGVIVARLALESPALARSLTLIAPALFWSPPLIVHCLRYIPGGRAFLTKRVGALVIGKMEQSQLSHPERVPNYIEHVREQLAFPGFGESHASTLLDFGWGRDPDMAAIGNHDRAVLIVWGDQDTTTPFANASRVAKLFPKATLLTVKGAKHAPHLDHPDDVRPAIIRHLHASRSVAAPSQPQGGDR